MGKGKIHWFYDPIYCVNYYVQFGRSCDALLDCALDNGDNLNRPDRDVNGAFWSGEFGVYLWLDLQSENTASKQLGVIAHECGHAAVTILSEKGVPIHDRCDEAFCYYLQFLVKNVMDAKSGNLERKGVSLK